MERANTLPIQTDNPGGVGSNLSYYQEAEFKPEAFVECQYQN